MGVVDQTEGIANYPSVLSRLCQVMLVVLAQLSLFHLMANGIHYSKEK